MHNPFILIALGTVVLTALSLTIAYFCGRFYQRGYNAGWNARVKAERDAEHLV